MKSGPIILIEDDIDDHDIFNDALKDLEIYNKLVWFKRTRDAFNYLKTTSDQPFIIFSDVNLPGQTGIDFKKEVDADEELRQKSIPFVFYTTTADQGTVNEAYTEMTIQGFFKKSSRYEEMKENIGTILAYWKICKHPNTF